MAYQFSYASIHKPLDYDDRQWWFTAAMISTCQPLLDGCCDNYEVEDLLRKGGVIDPAQGDTTDTESCQMFVYFTSKVAGQAFIERLNTWLREREATLRDLRVL